MNLKAIRTMTPKAIDTRLADLWDREQAALLAVEHLTKSLDHAPEFRRERIVKDLEMARATCRSLRTEAMPFEAEYKSRPWRRYFLVTNGNGHVHRGRNCSTCFPTTRYGWLVELADCDERAMVAEYGEKACTVCFPDAPSLYAMLGGKARIEREADGRRAEREAKRAEAAAKKIAKAITNPDGTVLKGRTWRVETVHAAWLELTDITETVDGGHYAAGSYVEQHLAEYREAADRIAAALAAKLGRSVEEIKAEATKKAKRRGGK